MGAVIALLLAGGLAFFLLWQKPDQSLGATAPANNVPESAPVSAKPEAISAGTPVVVQPDPVPPAVVSPAAPVAAPVPASIPEISIVSKIEPEPPKPPEPSKPVAVEPSIPEPVLPAHVLLSEQEVRALSPQERKQYEAMLKSLREVKQQVDRLAEERKQMEERMAQMEGRNQNLTSELDRMRKILEEGGERPVTHPPSPEDGGKPSP